MEFFNRDLSLSLRGNLGMPVMRSRLLGPLLVSPYVQRVSQICFLAQPAKDVARATSFNILVKVYSFGASYGPIGGWRVEACDLSPRVGTHLLHLFSHRVFTRTLPSWGFWVFTHLLWRGCMLSTHCLIPSCTCLSRALRGTLGSPMGFPTGVWRLSSVSPSWWPGSGLWLLQGLRVYALC